MGTSPNGLNINAGVGSTHQKLLAKMVVEKGADAVATFDGDGDRVIAVDELGNIVDGDAVICFYLCRNMLSSRTKTPKKRYAIVTTVMSNFRFS